MDQRVVAIRLLRVGAVLPVLLGTLHGFLTLLDTFKPRFFTPVDDEVRLAMARTNLRLTDQMELWPAWLGFNFSHGLGLVCIGLSLLLISFSSPKLVLGFTPLSALAMAASIAYFILAVQFWFYVVALGAALSFLCVAASVFIASQQP
jgi:hypothetical protein